MILFILFLRININNDNYGSIIHERVRLATYPDIVHTCPVGGLEVPELAHLRGGGGPFAKIFLLG